MVESDLDGFRQRLKGLIGGDSVNRFAMDVGLGDNLIRQYLKQAVPGLDKVVQICRAKGCRLEWLAEGRGSMYALGAAEDRTSYVVQPSDDAEFVEIPHYSIQASTGLGAQAGDAKPTYYWHYRRDRWALDVGDVSPGNCFTLEIRGDSMAPLLTERDRPIINTAEHEVLTDAIYVFRLDGEIFIKRLERVPGRGLLATSENTKYSPWEIGDGSQYDEFKVIGRVIYKETGERL